jgi:hypothetical protein
MPAAPRWFAACHAQTIDEENIGIRQCNDRGRSDTERSASGEANMDTLEIIAAVVLLLVGTGVAYYLLQHRAQPVLNVRRAEVGRDSGRQSEIQRDFARVFSMTNAQGKENLIKRWMERNGCDRTEAMRLATEEWRRDNR